MPRYKDTGYGYRQSDYPGRSLPDFPFLCFCLGWAKGEILTGNLKQTWTNHISESTLSTYLLTHLLHSTAAGSATAPHPLHPLSASLSSGSDVGVELPAWPKGQPHYQGHRQQERTCVSCPSSRARFQRVLAPPLLTLLFPPKCLPLDLKMQTHSPNDRFPGSHNCESSNSCKKPVSVCLLLVLFLWLKSDWYRFNLL